jgi:hypothetical protein
MRTTGKVAAAAIAISLAGCGSASSPRRHPPSPPPPVPLTASQKFVAAYRGALAAEGQLPTATDAQITRLGRAVCAARKAGASQSALMHVGGNGTILNKLAEQDLCPQYRQR